MPIAADLRPLYRTPESLEARRACLDRCKGRCEWCGKPRGWVIVALDKTGRWAPLVTKSGTLLLIGLIDPRELLWARPPAFNAPRLIGDPLRLEMETPKFFEWRWIRIAPAHLDHNPANNAGTNLAGLCGRCHLLYDGSQHRQNARLRRDRESGQLRLELVA